MHSYIKWLISAKYEDQYNGRIGIIVPLQKQRLADFEHYKFINNRLNA